MKKGIKKFGAFFIATCIASTMVTSVSAESLSGNTEQHNLIEYFTVSYTHLTLPTNSLV